MPKIWLALCILLLAWVHASAQILFPILTGQHAGSPPPPGYTDLCSTAAMSGTCVYPMSIVHRLASTGSTAMVLRRASDSATLSVGFVTSPNGPPAAALSGVAGMWVDRKSADNFCSGTTCTIQQIVSQDGSGCNPSQSVVGNQFHYLISPTYGTPETWNSRNGVNETTGNAMWLTTAASGGGGGGTTDCSALNGPVPKTLIGESNTTYPSQVGGQMGLTEENGPGDDTDGAMFSFMYCQGASFCGPKGFGVDEECGGSWGNIPNQDGDAIGIIAFSGAAWTGRAHIVGNVLTVDSTLAGAMAAGLTITGNCTIPVQPGTVVTGPSGGNWLVNISQNVSSQLLAGAAASAPGKNIISVFHNGTQVVTNHATPSDPINTEGRMNIGCDGDWEFCGPFWFRSLVYSSVDQTANAAAINAYEQAIYSTLANTPAINVITISGNGSFFAGVAGTPVGHVAPQDTPALGVFNGTLSMVSSGTAWDGVPCAVTNGTNFQVSANGAVSTKIALSAGTYAGVCVNALMNGVSYTQEFTFIASPPPANAITATNVSGSTVTNYPLQFGRPFVDGAIPKGTATGTGTGTVSNAVLTISAGSGFAVGQVITWSGATIAAPVITSLGTGTGGAGTYNLSSALPSTNTTTITGSAQQCPVMSINGTPATSQFDIKNRFPDGSVEFGIGAVVIPSIAHNAQAVVTFAPGACNNTPLTIAQMTGGSYNFDADINLKSPATLLGISQNNNNLCANFAAVSNGGFAITVNGTPYNFGALNFSSIKTCAQAAAIINNAAVGLGAPILVVMQFDVVTLNPRFQVLTTTAGSTTTLSYASAPSAGTDISGAGFLGWTSGTVGTGNATRLTGYVPALTGSNLTVNAKTIMNAATGGACSAPGSAQGSNTCILWTSGGVAQMAILTDESVARAYDQGFDVGSGATPAHSPFHPRIYATFWPALNQVSLRYVGENGWTTLNGDLNYVLTLTAGSTSPVTVYTKDLTGSGVVIGNSGFAAASAIPASNTGTLTISGTPSPALVTNQFYNMLDRNTGEWFVVQALGGSSIKIIGVGNSDGGPQFGIAIGDQLIMGSQPIHWSQTRWTRTAWIGSAPSAQVNIDYGLSYLASTRYLPNYDTSFSLNASSVSSEYANYTQNPNNLYDALWDQPSNSTSWQNGMGSEGARQDIGPYPQWSVMYLYGDWRMRQVALGLADQASSWPAQLRENASGKRYLLTDTVASGTAFGKDISKVDRPDAYGGQWFSWGNATSNLTIPYGPIMRTPWTFDGAHQPAPFYPQYVLSGDPWYLEQLTAWASNDAFGCWGGSPTQRQGCGPYNAALATQTVYGGAINDQLRGNGWIGRNRAEAALAEPDMSVDKTYLTALTIEMIERWEGNLQLTGTPLDGSNEKNWALNVGGFGLGNVLTNNSGPFSGTVPPLHNWESICDPTQPDAPCGHDLEPIWLNTGIAGSETAMWMQGYVLGATGRIQDLGFPMQAVNNWTDQFWVNLINISGYPQLVGYYYFSPLQFGHSGYFANFGTLQSALNFSGTCCGFASSTQAGYSYYWLTNAGNGRQTWLPPGMAAVADHDTPGSALAYSWFNTNVYGVTAAGGYSGSVVNVWSEDPRWAVLPRVDPFQLPAQPILN